MTADVTGDDELRRLVAVMHALRAGCPWDSEQTHSSLLHYLVEETAEVVDAVEIGSDDDLREELGDLLLQIAFHSEIASERDAFDIDDDLTRRRDRRIDLVHRGLARSVHDECPHARLPG